MKIGDRISEIGVRRLVRGAAVLCAKEARAVLAAVITASAVSSPRAQAAEAFRASHVPFARLVARALSVKDEALRESLLALRWLMPVWLAALNQDEAFWRAFENVLAREMAAGLRAGSAGALQASSLEEILDRSRSRALLPTSLSSSELSFLSRDVRDAAIFSARTTNAEYLGGMARVIDDFLAGRINTATARLRLVKALDQLGYSPEAGFPGDQASAVPHAEEGSLQDLSSDRRIQLILDTQAQLAFGKGQEISGFETVDVFPAWELIRLSPRVKIRDWPNRWADVGGEFFGPSHRMIAHKDSPVWRSLGSNFSDSLGTTHPPFAFNSGMGWKAIDLAEAEELGVIPPGLPPASPGQAPEPRMTERPPVPTDLPSDLGEQLRRDLANATAAAEQSLARDIDAANRRNRL